MVERPKVWFFVLLLAVAAPIAAQSPSLEQRDETLQRSSGPLAGQPEGYDCTEPVTQHEINACAHLDYLDADEELNAQWKITSETMKQWDEEDARDDGRPGYFDTLLAAQRAWLAYRDAHCASEGYLFRGGSGEPMMVSGCLAALTRERTLQLRGLVEFDG